MLPAAQTASTSGRPQASPSYSYRSSSARESHLGGAWHGLRATSQGKRTQGGHTVCSSKDSHGGGGRKLKHYSEGPIQNASVEKRRDAVKLQCDSDGEGFSEKGLQRLGEDYFHIECSHSKCPSPGLADLSFTFQRAANCLAVLLVALNLTLPPQSFATPPPRAESAEEIRDSERRPSRELYPSSVSVHLNISDTFFRAVSLSDCETIDCSEPALRPESSIIRSEGSSRLGGQEEVLKDTVEVQEEVKNLVQKNPPPTPEPEVSANLSFGVRPSREAPASRLGAEDAPGKEEVEKGAAEAEKQVKTLVEKSLPAASLDLDPEVNADLVLEAWNVVDQVYLDARGTGFDRKAWLAKREDALKHPIRSRIAAYSTIRSLMSSLHDPYTRFLAPEQFQALSKFDVSGIGLNMGEIDDNGMTSLRVLGVVHDSVAHAAGIRQGDELLRVGGTPVKGKSAFEATSLIQGPVGQPVTLELQKATGEVFEVVVPRGKKAEQPVTYKVERDAEKNLVGYVKLRDFSALAKKGVVEAIQRMKKAGAQSFILDLQDNLGGLVQAGIEIAKLFLDEGETVVYTEGRTPDTQKNVRAQAPAVFSAPLIVLVNENTASASEIVAGALHDNCRALLVGNKTYGKGLIQSVYELSDGSALAITVGKYITPGHIDIDKFGIAPDFTRPSGPFNWFLPLPTVKEVEAKLKACVPPKVEKPGGVLAAAISGVLAAFITDRLK